MYVTLSVEYCPLPMQFILRPLIGPEISKSVLPGGAQSFFSEAEDAQSSFFQTEGAQSSFSEAEGAQPSLVFLKNLEI